MTIVETKSGKASAIDSSEIDRIIGSRLREVRKMHGMTQAQMADLLQIPTQQSYSRYELGQASISASTLFRMADALQISIDRFFPLIGASSL